MESGHVSPALSSVCATMAICQSISLSTYQFIGFLALILGFFNLFTDGICQPSATRAGISFLSQLTRFCGTEPKPSWYDQRRVNEFSLCRIPNEPSGRAGKPIQSENNRKAKWMRDEVLNDAALFIFGWSYEFRLDLFWLSIRIAMRNRFVIYMFC